MSRSRKSLEGRVVAWQSRDPWKHPPERHQRQLRKRLRQTGLGGDSVGESLGVARRSVERSAWGGRRQRASACAQEERAGEQAKVHVGQSDCARLGELLEAEVVAARRWTIG